MADKLVSLHEIPTSNYCSVYRESLTGFMYFQQFNCIAPLFDPENGKPLSFERYKELLGEDPLDPKSKVKYFCSYDRFDDYEE